jgi:hypothetical protein
MNWNLLFNYIQPNSFIDIGAHVGDFTHTVKSKFPKCECLMIEANPYCEPYLKQTSLDYIITTLYSSSKKLPLFVEKINKIGTGASLYKENTEFYDDGKFDYLSFFKISFTIVLGLFLFPLGVKTSIIFWVKLLFILSCLLV